MLGRWKPEGSDIYKARRPVTGDLRKNRDRARHVCLSVYAGGSGLQVFLEILRS